MKKNKQHGQQKKRYHLPAPPILNVFSKKFHGLVLGLEELIDAKCIGVAWLNLYGHEAVRRKLKKGLKTQKMHFLPVFELMSDSLTAIQVEKHQCPSHQSILLTQGPIHENFMKKY